MPYVPRSRRGVPALTQSQSRAAGRRHAAQRACTDPGRRGIGQDPRPHHPDRLVIVDRAGFAGRRHGRHFHQQGGAGNDDAAAGDAAGQRARHVDRHLPRPVQPVPASPLQAGQSAAEFPDPRSAGPVVGHQAADEAAQRGRRAFSRQADPVVHRRLQGGRPASQHGGGALRRGPQEGRDLPVVRGAVSARRGGRLRRADAAQLRIAARQRPDPRPLPAALSPHPDRRVPGHQQAAVRLDQDVRPAPRRRPGCAAQFRVRRGRRRPEHLRVSRRPRRQHGRLRARVPCPAPDQAGAELPQPKQHPGRGQRADQPQQDAAGQEPANRPGARRAGAGVRGAHRPGRGAMDGGGNAASGARRRARKAASSARRSRFCIAATRKAG